MYEFYDFGAGSIATRIRIGNLREESNPAAKARIWAEMGLCNGLIADDAASKIVNCPKLPERGFENAATGVARLQAEILAESVKTHSICILSIPILH